MRLPDTTQPTNQRFLDQATAWGFTHRGQDGVHLKLRGPHGGTLRVLRSGLGPVNHDLVAKAAQLLDLTVERFWAGPDLVPQQPSALPAPGDTITARVLAIHATENRPLSFDQVTRASGGRLTREQVRTASSTLCRDGDLHRVRAGVYQFAAQPRTAAPPQAEEATGQQQAAPAHQMVDQILPGVNTELLADLRHWVELTEKLLTQAS